MNKQAQSEIITTVLIILLVLAAIIIVWQVVQATLHPVKMCHNMTEEKFVGTFLAEGTEQGEKTLNVTFFNMTDALYEYHMQGTTYMNCTNDFSDGLLHCSVYDRTINNTCGGENGSK